MRHIDDDSDLKKELPAPDEPPALEPLEASRADSVTRVETQRTSPALVRWIAVAVIVIILAFLILLLARWIYHKSHHSIQPAPATSQQAKQGSGANTQSGANPQSGNSNTGSNGSGQSGAVSSLPNNGPGNVAGVFAVSAAAAAGLHYVIRSRRYDS